MEIFGSMRQEAWCDTRRRDQEVETKGGVRQKLGDSDQISIPINHGNLVGQFSSGIGLIGDRWLGVPNREWH